MGIAVYYTYLEKGEIKEVGGTYQCFGATGRVDWNGCNPAIRPELVDFCRNEGIDYPVDKRSYASVPWAERDIKTIRLKSDSFARFFHVSNRKFLDYLVHRSPWAPLFTDTAEQIFHQNYVDLRVDVLPSEVQTWLHIQIRDQICRTTFGITFDTLVQGGIDENLAFGISLLMPALGINNVDTTFGNEGIRCDFNLKWFLDPSFSKLTLFPYTMKEVHGYIMNINKMFDNDSELEETIEHLVENLSTVKRVSGLFISKNMRIIDPIQLANTIKEAL